MKPSALIFHYGSMLTALAVFAASQTTNPRLKPVVTKIVLPKIAFLPTRASFSSTEKYVGSQYAIEGADLGLAKPKAKPVLYTVVPMETFRTALTNAGADPKAAWNLGAARTAAKAVGADYVAGLELKSAEMIKNPKQYYVTVKAELTIFRLDAPGAKTKVVALEANDYGPRRDLDTSTMPTSREATFILGNDTVPRWFAKHKAELD